MMRVMRTNRHLVAAWAIAGVMISGSRLSAATPAPGILAAAKTITCVFPAVATGTWAKGGEPEATIKPAKLMLRFETINTDQGTARLVEEFGISDIVVAPAAGALHFIQVFRDGPIYVTTVFDHESRAGKQKAVQTRHEYTTVSLPGFTSRPEQYYGECELQR
jgi:hypothetical protein